MSKHLELFAALAAPFEPHEVKARSQSGRQLHYVTARTVMNRLDNVLGPDNWWDEYVPGENSVLCRLTIRLPDGSLLTKSDAGGYAGMADSGDDDKSGYSDSFKRAAVKFGVARYLYRDGVPAFVLERDAGRGGSAAGGVRDPSRNSSNAARRHHVRQPPSHRQEPLRLDERPGKPSQVGLLRYLNQWAKLQEFPGRMVDWDAEQVNVAYHEAIRKLQSLQAVESAQESYDDVLAN